MKKIKSTKKLELLIAKHYVEALSESVKKAMEESIKKRKKKK